jgi:hypothetical protein
VKDATTATVTVFLLSLRVSARLLRLLADLLDDLARLADQARGRDTETTKGKGDK